MGSLLTNAIGPAIDFIRRHILRHRHLHHSSYRAMFRLGLARWRVRQALDALDREHNEG